VRARGKWEIISDILNAMNEEIRRRGYARKTRVMQKAFLDWRTFQKYFDFLIEQKFIEVNSNDKKYRITDKGLELLRNLREIRRFMHDK